LTVLDNLDSTCLWSVPWAWWFSPKLWLVQGSYSYPRWLKSPLDEILEPPGWILGPWGTLNKSHGTKIFVSKFFSYESDNMLFYVIIWSIGPKLEFCAKNWCFGAILAIS
jgi:hypothetical protein